MNRRESNPKGRLILFTRYPEPGKTKTRLIAHLGKVGAADVQRKLTEDVYKTALRTTLRHGLGLEICFDGGSKQAMRRWLGNSPVYSQQTQGDLGGRMGAAFLKAFVQGSNPVVLIGSDIADVEDRHLLRAFELLTDHDLVLGPVKDGGYWLVGMKSFHEIFDGTPWSTDTVLAHTLAMAETLGLKTGLLDPLRDIDTLEDIEQWDVGGGFQRPYLTVIIPTLNEEAHVERSIASAQDKDSKVIVVDGGSSDQTLAKALAAGAQVQTSARGRSVQQNSGAASARGRVLLFLHADTALPAGYVSDIFEALLSPRVVGGAFRFKTDSTSPMMRIVEFVTNMRAKHLKLPYGDQALFVRNSVFNDMGGFPDTPIAEDLFFVKSLTRRGRIRISPVAAVTSSRRWRRLGVLRTTLINQVVLAGCCMGLSPRVLADLHQRGKSGALK